MIPPLTGWVFVQWLAHLLDPGNDTNPDCNRTDDQFPSLALFHSYLPFPEGPEGESEEAGGQGNRSSVMSHLDWRFPSLPIYVE